ncbi:MAG: hypothetical protein VYC39_17360 [Myxococcota bacterium]|nr:hypothetical protein [Myxococcota bacterium]
MSQMQTFEFLSTLASLKLPETVSDKQDYFSDADAAAWAKEAEAAGLKTDIEDESRHETAESLSNDREQNEQKNVDEKVESEEAESALAYSSTAQNIAKDIWIDSLQKDNTSEALLKGHFHEAIDAETQMEEMPADQQFEGLDTDRFAGEDQEIASTDESIVATSEESSTYADALHDDGARILEDAMFDAEASEESAQEDLQAADNINSEAETEENSDAAVEEGLSFSASEALEAAALEFEEEIEQRQQLEISLAKERNELEIDGPELGDITHLMDFESTELGLQTGKGIVSGDSVASKMVAKIAKAYAAMQARANAIASQQSFTLRGSEFGGQLDIKMRNTGRGLDLTLMPQVLSQAGALTGSLRQIKDLLNNRGITTQRVQLDTEKLTDFWGLNRERFVDTSFFSGMQIANDNLSSNDTALRETTFPRAELTNQGELV